MRSLLLSLLLLLVAGPAAAHAASIRVEQQGPSGEPVTGGCYQAYNDDYSVARCDYDGDDDPGVIVLPDLGTGTYDVKEYSAPPGYYAGAPFTVELTEADEVDRRVRRHQVRPVLRVVTTDSGGKAMAGSCWFVRFTGTDEGGWNVCDADDGSADGVTRFLDMEAGDYDLLHVEAPTGIDRVDTTSFTMPADEDKTLTFALEPAVKPANTVAPSIAGGHSVGDELTGSIGTWTGSAEIDYMDAWERCDPAGTDCEAVDDYDETYTVTADDAGKALRYRVIATNDGGRVAAWSALHAIVSLDAPEPTTRPSITGSTSQGALLTAHPGEWTNSPTFTYQWQHCAGDCTDIANATGATYRTVGADAGQRIRVVVTAHNSAGERSATSEQTEPVSDAPFNQVRPSTTGTPAAHNIMEAFPGSWGTYHAPLSYSYAWLRCDLDGTSSCVTVARGEYYAVQQEDEGHTLLVEVTATDAGGSATARSNPRTVLIQRPLPVQPPSITGDAMLGDKLTAHLGTWSPEPSSLKFYWERCEYGKLDRCEKVNGSDGDRTHKIDEDDLTYAFRITVWAFSTEGGGYARSEASGVVARWPPTNYVPPSITGTARIGQKLVGDPGVWSKPLDWGLETYWYRCEPEDVEARHCKQILPEESSDWAHRSYEIQRRDVGYVIRMGVYATHDLAQAFRYSNPSDVVTMVPPVNTVAPSIAGVQRLGQKLTANRGTWTADAKLELEHWWMRCDADGNACQAIDGAKDDKTHTVSRDDLGHTLKLAVRATTREGDAEAWSRPTVQITEQPPVALVDPSIAGAPRVDEKLTASLGVWTPALNEELEPRWYRCASNGTGCEPIDGADGRTYRVRYSDIGHRIKLLVTAVSDEGRGTAWSAATGVIAR